MHFLINTFFLFLALAVHNFVAWAQPSSSSTSSSSSSSSKRSGIFNGDGKTFVEKESPVKCLMHLIEPYMIDPDADEKSVIVCVLDMEYEGDSISGTTYELDVPSFPYGFFDDVDYSKTILSISLASIRKSGGGRGAAGVGGRPTNFHGGGVISMKNGATAKKEWRNNDGDGSGGLRGSNGERNGMLFDRSRGRRLAQTMGNSSLIVLYAIPRDASNTHRTSSQLANDVFGINVTETQDPVNVRSQVLRCSGGKLNYVPACGTPEQSCYPIANQSISFVNGVLQVPINYNVTGIASGTVKNWVEAEAQKILQAQNPPINLFSFNQIMHVIPDAADWGGAAAWAYLPGQTSAFRSSYSFSMGVQVHEFGHNIGLHHSGYNGASYADHSCLMGNPSYGDDGPAICWNGAKSWETGWYDADSVDVIPSSTAPFLADLIGVADWSEGSYTPDNHRVVLRIVDSTEPQKYHIMYNRAKGPNVGVTFAKDQVTVTMGARQEVSWHRAALGPVISATNMYPVFRKEKFNGGDKWLVIKLCSMTTGTPDTASVMVYLDDGPALNNGFMCPGELPCIDDSGCNDGNFCTLNACVNNTCMPPSDDSANLCPSCGTKTFCNPSGTCDPICTDNNQCTADSCVANTCQNAPIPGCTIPGAHLETWLGIGGSAVSDLTSNAAYLTKSPDQVMDIVGSLAAPIDRADNFGARLRTYLTPPATGTYTFYVASDDSSELWLSSDKNPANKKKIAWVNGWTAPQVWTTYTTQKSSPTNLTVGSFYYLEALYKEGGGGDHLSVAWQSTNAGVPLGVIDGSFFFEEPPVPCTSNADCLSTNPCNSGQCDSASTLCNYTPIAGCENGAQLETWLGISGGTLSSLKTNTRFPNSPNSTIIVRDILEAPTNRADNYGARLQTYITPPVTGNYTFYIASDDAGELYLSNSTDIINKVMIAFVTSWTGVREWKKYSTQKSKPMTLEKGKLYFMEALHKEGGGGDNLAIAWECLDQNIALGVIRTMYTSVLLPSTRLPTSSPSTGPTEAPTYQPISSPTKQPTHEPTNQPSSRPSSAPTTANPTQSPTFPQSTNQPSSSPSSASITVKPTQNPTLSPTHEPTNLPSSNPSPVPTTGNPTQIPLSPPTNAPTNTPSSSPSFSPTTIKPTALPSSIPSRVPTNSPTNKPTGQPTSKPTYPPCSSITTKTLCTTAGCAWSATRKRCTQA